MILVSQILFKWYIFDFRLTCSIEPSAIWLLNSRNWLRGGIFKWIKHGLKFLLLYLKGLNLSIIKSNFPFLLLYLKGLHYSIIKSNFPCADKGIEQLCFSLKMCKWLEHFYHQNSLRPISLVGVSGLYNLTLSET